MIILTNHVKAQETERRKKKFCEAMLYQRISRKEGKPEGSTTSIGIRTLKDCAKKDKDYVLDRSGKRRFFDFRARGQEISNGWSAG